MDTRHTSKKSTGAPCTICSHPDKKQIDSAIAQETPFRNLVERFGLSLGGISRHTTNHLRLEIQALVKQKRIQGAIDVYREFEEQLAFAKDLREAARHSLTFGSVIDLSPKSQEIDVVYSDPLSVDHNGEMAKRKDTLENLLFKLAGIAIAGHVVVKTVDPRKFALDAINTTDACIDKFAKLAGAYQKDDTNETDISKVIRCYQKWLDDYPDARPEEKREWITWFAEGSGIDEAELVRSIQVREITLSLQ